MMDHQPTSGLTALLPTLRRGGSSRKSPNAGASVIPSFRGREGLLATKFIVLKASSKALLERVLGGSKIDTLK